MKIAVCTSFALFERHADGVVAERLTRLLESGGHQVEHVRLPFADEPDFFLSQFAAFRWVDVSAADRIVCFAPAAHLIPHSRKIVWFTRFLADSVLPSTMPAVKEGMRRDGLMRAIAAADRTALREAQRVWAASPETSEQLSQRFGISSCVMAPHCVEAWQLDGLLS